jgi:hypothetical protein
MQKIRHAMVIAISENNAMSFLQAIYRISKLRKYKQQMKNW